MRVATFNAYWDNRNYSDVIELLGNCGATLIALQETTPHAETLLKVRLGHLYPHQFYAGQRDRGPGERFGLLSKVPLRNVEFIPPRQGLFGFLTAEFAWAGQSVKIINVHLAPFDLSVDRSIFQQIPATEKRHHLEIEEIVQQTKAGEPTLILGDFNSLSDFEAPTKLRSLGYRDSFAEMHKTLNEADQHPTWIWPIGETEIKLRIDYIFHDAHWITQSSSIADYCHSDHYLLSSELAFVDE